ncbi:hypothetical protein KUV22_01955 [Microbulbifer agarilyticus]|uniref:hypothetical protein n=1 Tax=Microbulbifer agarilyticus TaxID=260552 RepID=UPI001C98A788|nr:hypothetical protein [Microbulbifer agarilyticus]MBY6189173.1 hypothetical protein [Microbulbifer agarilyticus]
MNVSDKVELTAQIREIKQNGGGNLPNRDSGHRPMAKRLALLESKASLADEYQAQVERLLGDVQELRVLLAESESGSAGKVRDAELASENEQRLKAEVESLKSSTAFRLGLLIVEAFARPGKNLVFLPYRITKLFYTGFRNRLAARRLAK